MLLGELSKELRSDGGFGDVVSGGSVDVDAGKHEGSVDALSVSLSSWAGRTGGLSCRGSSIIPDSAICLYSPRRNDRAETRSGSTEYYLCRFHIRDKRRQCNRSV
jgi:hypothetical protein